MYGFFITINQKNSLYSMKVVLPADSEHTIIFIPRVYPTGALSFFLLNESDKVETLVPQTYVTTDGLIFLTFTFTFAERDKYQIRILEGTEVIYRGKLFATDQEPQEFRITTNFIEYS